MIRNFVRQSRPWIQNLEVTVKNNTMKNNFNKTFDDLVVTKKNVKEVVKPRKQILEEIVKEYNERWKENITVEDYLENFTRKHRGAC